MGSLWTQSLSIYLLWMLWITSPGDAAITATCDVQPNSATPLDQQQPIRGTVSFSQADANSPTSITISLSGFSTTDSYTQHGFHVHETGDISGGCGSTGGHYNPTSVDHGGLTASVRHVGDLGNIQEDSQGSISRVFTDNVAKLDGSHSIINKAIVIHEKADDLGQGGDSGSLTTGNAGGRLACCVIKQTSAAPSAKPFVGLFNMAAALIMSQVLTIL